MSTQTRPLIDRIVRPDTLPATSDGDGSGSDVVEVAPFRLLRRHLGLVIVVKLALLVVLFLLFFSPSHRPQVDAGSAADRILSPR